MVGADVRESRFLASGEEQSAHVPRQSSAGGLIDDGNAYTRVTMHQGTARRLQLAAIVADQPVHAMANARAKAARTVWAITPEACQLGAARMRSALCRLPGASRRIEQRDFEAITVDVLHLDLRWLALGPWRKTALPKPSPDFVASQLRTLPPERIAYGNRNDSVVRYVQDHVPPVPVKETVAVRLANA